MPRKKQSMLWQLITGLAVGLTLGYLGLCLFAVVFADRMIFPVPPRSYKDSAEIIKLSVGSEPLAVSALYLENPEAEFTILYSHGNGEDLGDIRPFLQQLRSAGYAVFAYDYPGYGTSEGVASEQASFDAAEAAYDYLAAQVPPERIILFGRSLGSGPSWHLAAQKPVAGIIIDGGFSSTFRVITKVKILPWDKFDNLALADEIQCPALFIHGKLDKTVPFTHAQAMYEAVQTPKSKLFIDDAGHNNLIERAGAGYWDAIRTFTQTLRHPHE